MRSVRTCSFGIVLGLVGGIGGASACGAFGEGASSASDAGADAPADTSAIDGGTGDAHLGGDCPFLVEENFEKALSTGWKISGPMVASDPEAPSPTNVLTARLQESGRAVIAHPLGSGKSFCFRLGFRVKVNAAPESGERVILARLEPEGLEGDGVALIVVGPKATLEQRIDGTCEACDRTEVAPAIPIGVYTDAELVVDVSPGGAAVARARVGSAAKEVAVDARVIKHFSDKSLIAVIGLPFSDVPFEARYDDVRIDYATR